MKFALFQNFRAMYAHRYEPEELRRLANIYWMLMISVAGVVVGASIFYGAWEYWAPLPEPGAGTATVTQSAPFNQKDLATIVERLNKQKAEFEAKIR